MKSPKFKINYSEIRGISFPKLRTGNVDHMYIRSLGKHMIDSYMTTLVYCE